MKHGGGNLIAWDCISTARRGQLIFIGRILYKIKFLDILKQNLRKGATNMGIQDSFKFYQVIIQNDDCLRIFIVKLSKSDKMKF